MQDFRSWIYNELANYRAYDRMVRGHSDYKGMPDHVRGEFIRSSFGHSVNSSSAAAMAARQRGEQTPAPMRPSEFLQKSPYRNRDWSKKAAVVQLKPDLFDKDTLNLFIHRCFGYRPLPTIRDDASRMDIQRQKITGVDPGSNEPVIVLKNGDKYRLQEGWHRTMTMLIWEGGAVGAPDDQIQILKQYAMRLREIDNEYLQRYGDLNNGKAKIEWIMATMPIIDELSKKLDYSKWVPVPIQAFVGAQQEMAQAVQQQQAQVPQPQDRRFSVSTGDYDRFSTSTGDI